MQNNIGLNGFRTWWTKWGGKVKTALAFTGPVGILIGALIDLGWGERLEYEFDLPLTAGEETILDGYIENQFIPYYNDTVQLVGGEVLVNGKVIELSLVDKINIALKRIALLRAYLNYQDLYPPSNYTGNMLTSRKKFVNEYLGYLYTAIKEFGTANGIDITNAQKTAFTASAIKDEAGMQFTWTRAISAHYNKVDNTKIIVIEDVIADTNAGNDPSGEVIVVGEEIEPTTGSSATKSNSNLIWKLLAALGITIGVVAVVSNSDDKKSK